MIYKKGDYIKVSTNQPVVHISMVVDYDLSSENVAPSEYTARVISVIGNDEAFLIYIPSVGFRCVVDSSEVLRRVSEEELTDEEICHKDNSEFTAPDVYICKEDYKSMNNAGRCLIHAMAAMCELSPKDKVVSVELCHSNYLKSDLLRMIDHLIKERCSNNQIFQKKRDYFKEMLKHLRFKEYYNVRIGIEDELDDGATNFTYLAVDTKFEEVAMSSYDFQFILSLGPEYTSVSNYFNDLRMEILSV